MYVRLAFAVAAHLESEILIVDEVLAVGDAEFQKKCMGKMGDVSKGEGRTILFVSHNMQMSSALCQQSVMLKNGEIVGQGLTSDIINTYLNPDQDDATLTLNDFRPVGGKQVRIESISLDQKHYFIDYNQPITLNIEIRSLMGRKMENLNFSFGLNDLRDRPVCNSATTESFSIEPNQSVKVRLTLTRNKHLMPGKYKVALNLLEGQQFSGVYESKDMIYGFPVVEIRALESDGGYPDSYRWNQGWGSILFDNHIEVTEIK